MQMQKAKIYWMSLTGVEVLKMTTIIIISIIIIRKSLGIIIPEGREIKQLLYKKCKLYDVLQCASIVWWAASRSGTIV